MKLIKNEEKSIATDMSFIVIPIRDGIWRLKILSKVSLKVEGIGCRGICVLI